MVFGEALDAQVAAEEGLAEVDVLDFYLDFVALAFGLLGAVEAAPCSEVGAGRDGDYAWMGVVGHCVESGVRVGVGWGVCGGLLGFLRKYGRPVWWMSPHVAL